MKTILSTILFALTGLTGFSQLDSVAVTVSFTSNPSITMGLDSMALETPVMQVLVSVNDVDYAGKISVLVYDGVYNTPMNIVKYDRAQLLAGGMMEAGRIVYNFGNLDPAGSYRIVVEAQNFQLGYLEPVITFYTGH